MPPLFVPLVTERDVTVKGILSADWVSSTTTSIIPALISTTWVPAIILGDPSLCVAIEQVKVAGETGISLVKTPLTEQT